MRITQIHQDTVQPVRTTISSGIYWPGFDRIWCWTHTLRGLRLLPMYLNENFIDFIKDGPSFKKCIA